MVSRRSRRGSALVIAVLVVVIVTGMAAAFLSESLFRSRQAFIEREHNEAQMACDAALEQARRFLMLYRSTNSWPWNDILLYNQGFSTSAEAWKASSQAMLRSKTPNVSKTFPEAPVPAGSKTVPSNPPTYFGIPTVYHNAAFVLVVKNNSDDPGGPMTDTDRVLVATITATMIDGTQRQIEARLEAASQFFEPDAAIISAGPLKISGNPDITGAKGSAHSNMWITMSGNPTLSKNLTATGSISISGNPTVGGVIQAPTVTGGGGNTVVQGPVPVVPIPDTKPEDYESQLTYRLTSTGMILNSSGQLVHNGSGGVEWRGFKYEGSGRWSVSGNTTNAPPGLYYIEGAFKISGNPTITATFVAKNSVEISGNPKITPHMQSLAVVAGGDLKISGNPDLAPNVPAIYVAREQLHISGNPEIVGSIIVLDKHDLDPTVSTSSEIVASVSGNPSLHYDGGLQGMRVEETSLRVKSVRKTK